MVARHDNLEKAKQTAAQIIAARSTGGGLARPNPNAGFFARAATAQGKSINPMDLNPNTGNVSTPMDGLGDEQAVRNARALRSSNGGMTIARPGYPSQPKILGVDAKQAADQKLQEEHKNDAFFLQARAARQADPLAGHETPDQFAANNQAESPTRILARPAAPAPRPNGISVKNAGQDNPQTPKPTLYAGYKPPAEAGATNGGAVTPAADYTGTQNGINADFAKEVDPVRHPIGTPTPMIGRVAPDLPPPMAGDPSANRVFAPPASVLATQPPDDLQQRAQSFQNAARMLHTPMRTPIPLAENSDLHNTTPGGIEPNPTNDPKSSNLLRMPNYGAVETPDRVNRYRGNADESQRLTEQAVSENPGRKRPDPSALASIAPKKPDDDDGEDDFT